MIVHKLLLQLFFSFYISNPAQYLNFTTTALNINTQQIKISLREKM